jgi:hypothetical protein
LVHFPANFRAYAPTGTYNSKCRADFENREFIHNEAFGRGQDFFEPQIALSGGKLWKG